MNKKEFPRYDIFSPTVAIHYISGRLSNHFGQYVPVSLSSYQRGELMNIEFELDLSQIHHCIARLSVPLDLEYSFSGDMLARSAIEENLKKVLQELTE